MTLQKLSTLALSIITSLLVLIGLTVWLITFHPSSVQQEEVHCRTNAPSLGSGQDLFVYSQNVQFMAGKNYVFFYEQNNSGPDERPSTGDINNTLDKLAQVIRTQNPDVILLQEVDDGAKRTDNKDQLAQLLQRLPSEYACHSSSFYWQADYVPHPRVQGSVGMKLSIISKYKISHATRYQLAQIPADPISEAFGFNRALFEVRLPSRNGTEVAILNTHLSAFSVGTDTLQKQVRQISQYLASLDNNNTTWILGGDFNLLPPNVYASLSEQQRAPFNATTEMSPLYQQYSLIPSLKNTLSESKARWYTYFPNGKQFSAPDRTIDYLLYSKNIQLNHARVLQEGVLSLSDHMPLTAHFSLP